MRFALSLVAFVLAGILAAVGLASTTVLRPADHITAALTVPKDARYVVVPAEALRTQSGQQRLQLTGAKQVWVGAAQAPDVQAWLSGERYAQVTAAADGSLRASMRTAPIVAGLKGGAASPAGADLWLFERSAPKRLNLTLNMPAGQALLIAADGVAPAPSTLQVTWPVRAVTPLAGPELALAFALAILGLLAGAWAALHAYLRRAPHSRAPRRRFGALRRSSATLAVAAVATAAVVAGPVPGAEAAPSPAALTEVQAQRIIQRATSIVSIADASRNASLLSSRMGGPALTLREATYKILAEDKEAAVLQPVPAGQLTYQLVLPQATGSWPRTLFSVVSGAGTTTAPVALILTQADPRADYKIQYATSLQPGSQLPNLPSAVVGATELSAKSTALLETPAQLSADYGALLLDAQAPAAGKFDLTADTLAASVGEAPKQQIVKQLGGTATLTFADLKQANSADVIALAGSSGDALVAVPLSEQWTVKPKKKGVTVKPSGATQLLAATKSTKIGIQSVYGYQLLFFVPAAKSSAKATLIGYSQGLISAKELPTAKKTKK